MGKLKRAELFVFFLPAFFLGGFKNEFIFAAFSAVFLGFLVYKDFSLPKHNPWYYFLIWIFFSAIFASNPAISVFFVFKFAVFLAVFFWAQSDRDKLKIYFGDFIVFAGILLISYILFSKFFLNDPLGYKILGNNKNYAAALFSLCSVYLYYQKTKAKDFLSGLNSLSGHIMFLIAVLWLNSRGAFLSALFGILFVSLVFEGKKKFYYNLVFFVLATFFLAHYYDIFKFSDPKSYMRPYIWFSALKAAFFAPLFGYGPGLFENAFEIFKFPYENGGLYYAHFTAHAHSEFLNIAAETGIIGLLFFFYALYKTVVKASNYKDIYIIMAASLLLHAAVDVIFFLPLMWILFFILIGLSSNDVGEEKINPRIGFVMLFFLPLFLKDNYKENFLSNRLNVFKAVESAGQNAARRAAIFELEEKNHPKDGAFYSRLAEIYCGLKNEKKCALYIDKALLIEPKEPLALTLKEKEILLKK